jgi:hypothetical protein
MEQTNTHLDFLEEEGEFQTCKYQVAGIFESVRPAGCTEAKLAFPNAATATIVEAALRARTTFMVAK